MNVLEVALAWHDAGVSTMPPRQDGTKGPAFEWKKAQQELPPREMVESWYREEYGRTGVGIFCGQVSGNMEMLELEGCATSSADLDKIVAQCQDRGIDWLWDLLTQDGYAEWTPSGGLHFLYRVDGPPVPGNHKVAKRYATAQELELAPGAREKTLAETRGERGYVIVAPSHGKVHRNGQSWDLAAGAPGKVPTVTWADRCLLHQAIRAALHELPEAPIAPVRSISPGSHTSDSPGTDFMERVDWADILTPHGWQFHSQHAGNEVWWTRPGKNPRDGHSATTGRDGYGVRDRFFLFSSTVDDIFDLEKPYNKLWAHALLNYGSTSEDTIKRVIKDLATEGYGTPLERRASGNSLLLDSIETSGNPVPAMAGKNAAMADTAAESAAKAAAVTVTWDEEFSAPELTVDQFLEEDFDLQGAGNLFAKAYQNAFKYAEDTKSWWYWAGKVWTADGERFEQASKKIIDIGKLAASQARITQEPYAKTLTAHVTKLANASSPNIGRWARQDPKIRCKTDIFDSQSHLITAANGIIDLNTQQLMPHDPGMLLTKQIPVTYDKAAQAPRWQEFLNQAVPDAQYRSYLQRAIGHTLLGNAEQRAMFLLHGPSGTGKSVFIRVMEQLFGDFAEAATPATLNASSKTATLTNDLNDLKGKRFVSISELDENETLNESLVKRLTGGDTAKSRGLWQENSKWRVQFSMWLATNNLPRLTSDDNAIWRRMKAIPFTQVAADRGAEVLRLAEKIFAEEASGILNWVLEGVQAYQEQGLEDPEQMKEAVKAYRRESDVVEQFLDSALDEGTLVTGDDLRIKSSHLHEVYAGWCQRNGYKGILSQRRFSQKLTTSGRLESRRLSDAVFWFGIGVGSRGILGTM